MKKVYVLLLICILLSFCSCSFSNIDTNAPETTPSIVDTTHNPVIENDDYSIETAEYGAQVVVSVSTNEYEYKDPESGTYTILSYSVENPVVFIESNQEASSKINEKIAEINSNYNLDVNAVGTEMDYVTYLQSLAEDFYNLKVETNADLSIYCSFFRTVSLERADSEIICISFNNSLYTDEMEQSTETYWFNSKTGEEIDEAIASSVLPPKISSNGLARIEKSNDGLSDLNVPVLDLICVDDLGDDYVIYVEGEICNVKFTKVGYIEGTFVDLNDLWLCNRMSDCVLQIKTIITSNTPNLKFSYETESGMNELIITYNAADDSVSFVLENAYNSVG